jgi:hypothetical protein
MNRKPEPRPGDILAALDELGVTADAKISGGEAYVLCPYHDDRSIGSFAISLENGLNHCFACGTGGSFHRYLMASQHMERTAARRWCLSRLIATTEPDLPRGIRIEISEASLALFTEPPGHALQNKAVTAESCRALGILWDPVKDDWIFPVRDPWTGRLYGWQAKRGRFMSNQPEEIPVHSCLFGWGQVPHGAQVVLVESPVDTAVMRDAGYCAVSSFGSVVSDAQLALITERAGSLVLALDDDKAGWKATDAIWRKPRPVPVRIFNYGGTPPGKDPGELDDEAIRWGMENLLC